ncbi:MAG: ethanolamine ammonia-lyase subunit EutC [Hyphomicrobium sp.]|nr:ethanolamine ammonia-lyase subunit EutC [Hyphomicrobium sp.]
MTTLDSWNVLRRFTDARIGLGRSGSGLPTREVLAFALAHAEARDAVLTSIAWEPVEQDLRELGFETLRAASAVESRAEYLRRPDLGRKLSHSALQTSLEAASLQSARPDLVIMVGDGLSSKAVEANIAPMLAALKPHIVQSGWRLGPVVLAREARVALGDEIGEAFAAKAVLVLIGERPGLSSPDSLGAYLTWAPKVGLKDAERNCVSNIRVRGLSYGEAAFKISWLLSQAFKRGLTGVQLKDESEYQVIGSKVAATAIGAAAKT